MHVDIFIRTYHKDLQWLSHALASIAKYVTGHVSVIVAIPKGQGHLLSHLTTERVVEVDDLPDGYIGQQMTKLEAWQHTDADVILYWDSDSIATEPVNVLEEYFKDGKPILYKTRYDVIADPNFPWRPITAKAVGFDVEWEYMRRLPLVYWRDDVKAAQEHIEAVHGTSLRAYLRAQPFRKFSEFNAIGAWIDRFNPDAYEIIDTETHPMPKNKLAQFWSWGGITEEVQRLINAALK